MGKRKFSLIAGISILFLLILAMSVNAVIANGYTIFLPMIVKDKTFDPTPTITQTVGYQKYKIEYEIETSSSRFWVPAPRFWDGKGLQSISYLEISPEPLSLLREESGTELFYWENNSGNVRIYRLILKIELTYIDISSAYRIIFPVYNEDEYIYKKNTESDENIQANSSEIYSMAKTIIGDEKNPYRQAKLIHKWMSDNIHYEPGDRDALSVLHKRGGDCAGKAHLYIAFLRSIGIPARSVAGIHSPGSSILQSGVWFPDKTMGYHVWTEFYLPDYGWAQVDPGSSTFEKINEHRIITSKGTDIKVGHGFPIDTVSWLHLPYNTHHQIENEPIRFNVTLIQ